MSEPAKKRDPAVAQNESAPATPAPVEGVPVFQMDEQLRRIALIIGMMIIAAGILGALVLVWPAIRMVLVTTLPFAVGLVFAYVFNPVVTFFQRKLRLSRISGVLFLYLVFIAAITGFFAVVLPILITQTRSAWGGIGDFVTIQIGRLGALFGTAPDGAPRTMAGIWAEISQRLEARGIMVSDIFSQAASNEGVRSAAGNSFQLVGDALAFVFAVIMRIGGMFAFLLFAVLVNIYLLLDFSKLRDLMEVMVPSAYRERTFDVLAKVDVAVGGFIRGSLITAALVGLMTWLGLTLIGMGQYALLIGIVAGIGNLVPYLGTICGATPAFLYVAFSSAYDGTQERLVAVGLLILLFGAIQAIEGFILQPKVVGQSAQLHPIAVLFALAFGANFGLIGMILAVPAACIIRVLVKEFYWDERENKWQKDSGKRALGEWRVVKKRKAAPS